TYSKGARFAGAAVLLALSLLPRRWWFTALTVVVLGGALAYSTFNGPERLDVGGDSSSARLSIWRSAAAMLADHPLAGVGMGQFYYYFNPEVGGTYIEEQLRDDPAESKTAHPHNLILDLLLRVGLLGALAFAALIGRTAWRGWRIWRSGHGERWLALAALAALGVGLLHGLVDQGYFSTDLALATWLSLGLIDGIWPEIGPQKARLFRNR
ncbi:MAG TPA: O-antigen ligase family protein, partial [Herpetosiphonaceae bacterium]|nr:O-antigen ligase family protein [Herpetosiphonaceae bacterium]